MSESVLLSFSSPRAYITSEEREKNEPTTHASFNDSSYPSYRGGGMKRALREK